MDLSKQRRIQISTALIALSAGVFVAFFFISKNGPFRDINPFNVDPWDAVGSFAFQVAMLAGVLTFARALRLGDHAAPAPTSSPSLILRGNLVALGAIVSALLADTVAEALDHSPPSYWGNVLRRGLAAMWGLTAISTAAGLFAFRGVNVREAPDGLTPADCIDDLWALVRIPAAWILPRRWAVTLDKFNSDLIFRRLPWVNPRRHPWTFACTLAALAGGGLVAGYWHSGPPPNPGIGLVVSCILLYGEFLGTMLGFLTLGGWLGLRPRFH